MSLFKKNNNDTSAKEFIAEKLKDLEEIADDFLPKMGKPNESETKIDANSKNYIAGKLNELEEIADEFAPKGQAGATNKTQQIESLKNAIDLDDGK